VPSQADEDRAVAPIIVIRVGLEKVSDGLANAVVVCRSDLFGSCRDAEERFQETLLFGIVQTSTGASEADEPTYALRGKR